MSDIVFLPVSSRFIDGTLEKPFGDRSSGYLISGIIPLVHERDYVEYDWLIALMYRSAERFTAALASLLTIESHQPP